ncbi:unnamed protein product, partial [Prunus brigantina]
SNKTQPTTFREQAFSLTCKKPNSCTVHLLLQSVFLAAARRTQLFFFPSQILHKTPHSLLKHFLFS